MLQRFVSATRALSAAATRPSVMSSALRGPVRGLSAEVDAAAAPTVVAAAAAAARKNRVSRPRTTSAGARIQDPMQLIRSSRLKAAVRRVRESPTVDAKSFPTKEVGERGTLEWRMQFERPAKTTAASPAEGSEDAAATTTPAVASPYSPWHHINLLVNIGDQYLRYVNEIPKGTRPKMEIATKEPWNPIKQDIKKGALRDFTYGDIPFNYGALPQTWENPHKAHVLTGKPGDNDPIDVVEVSDTPIDIGAVRVVRVLGAMALLDEGETDFKILAIDMAHPLAKQITSPESLEAHMPGKIAQIREWFKMYKTTDGKPENEFAFNGEVTSAGVARGIIWETHHEWGALLRGEIDNGGLSLSSEGSELRLPNSLQSPKLLLSDLSFVVNPAHRNLMMKFLTTLPERRRDQAFYDRLRAAYESAEELASKSAADGLMMEPTLRAFRKTFLFYLSCQVAPGTKLPAVMPGAAVQKSVNDDLVTARSPKPLVSDRQSQLVNAMVDPRARDFMLMFNLMSREQTRTQVVYTQLATIYKILVGKVEKEEKNKSAAATTAVAAEATAPETASPARTVQSPRTYVADLRVICGALRSYFVDRNVVTREPVPPTMPIIAGDRSTPAPEPAATPAVAPVTTRPRKPRSTDAKTATGTTNTTIAKSEGRERKPRNGEPRKPRETRERKPREPTKAASETTSEPAAKATPAAAPSEESVGDLLAKVMSKLNSTPM